MKKSLRSGLFLACILLHASITVAQHKKPNIFKRFITAFNALDTTYITPNKYHWAVMMQNTNSFESFVLNSKETHQKLAFTPKPSVKVGPYIGWHWIFLGYTYDIMSIGKNETQTKTEFELSLYSQMIGCDLIYRKTGNDFRFRKIQGLDDNAQTAEALKKLEGTSAHGIEVGMMGINAYYVSNHDRFSYPAAFAQTSCQRKSCGTWVIGASYTRHELEFDYDALHKAINPNNNNDIQLSSDFQFKELKYTDISISCGYAYNWVFARNWLACISLTPAIGYKKSHSDIERLESSNGLGIMPSINLDNFNIDVTGRLGLVWNNTKYFGGLSVIVHNYNYRHDRLAINNTFGTFNAYFGLNFHKRKK